MSNAIASIPMVMLKRGADIRAAWLDQLTTTSAASSGRIANDELKAQADQFLKVLGEAIARGRTDSIEIPEWAEVRAFLDDLSRRRALAGFAAHETATFVFSLKRPLFEALRQDSRGDHRQFADDAWAVTALLDMLGLHTVKAYQRAREEVINRQQEELLELSTPVVKLWDGILALPMIGTLDSSRTQIVMESLLQKIAETESQIAILDITGVPTVDTLVAQHLLKTVTALRLMGAECIISGVRPQIAQTIVHLGVDLQGVATKASLADALALALRRIGVSFVRQ
ncbi:MAG TPA: STAS domain-containing protein [Steroidobacteraceae bacterium]|jgi:rsbT co-antagonist protein RsbR|nr:STAS domain-containing protein [Steroidobacteraceae bacterium]